MTSDTGPTELDKELVDAVKAGDLEAVRELLHRGAQPNVSDRYGGAVFFSAILSLRRCSMSISQEDDHG